jgi:3-deoxy-D-arabino-heptulosonate 7-phosphate (DAHP) synthase
MNGKHLKINKNNMSNIFKKNPPISFRYKGFTIMQTATQSMKDLMQEKWNKRPLIISGPCSAETEEQVLETATRLAATGKSRCIACRYLETTYQARFV